MKSTRQKKGYIKATFTVFWITVGLLILPTLVSAASYSVSLQKGGYYQKIDVYEKDIWNNTISSINGPEYYFEGDSNITGSESKGIIRSWYQDTVNTSDLFFNLLFPQEQLLNITFSPFNKTYIDENYNTTYKINLVLISKWGFNSSALPENATEPNNLIYVLRDPIGFKTLLDDYNAYVSNVSTYPFIDLVAFNIEDFLFNLLITQMSVGAPIESYLSEMVDDLNNENVTSEGNTLALQLRGETNYSVQISFGSTGFPSSITFLDSENNVFYKIITYDTEWTVWLIIGIVGASIITVVIYAFYRRRKRMKRFEESLERMKS
ncbi:MAG: hypothetical protein BAJALOKI3v1_390035 [Promethearchaeota archaeon]|nr:MAG: hypothetical protein BAJALOKI3v1_390035 [Candidatus Lokiarchaeota archaeon]